MTATLTMNPFSSAQRAPRAHFFSQLAFAQPERKARSALQQIIEQRALTAVFQPILDMKTGDFLGFEGLIRGPADTQLHSPFHLFAAAQHEGLSLELELLAREITIESFAAQNLPGMLFLNVSPTMLTNQSCVGDKPLAFLSKVGMTPERIMIEITENQPTFNFDQMRDALQQFRLLGFNIAIDDLGEGFSSLRLWSELRPDFIKIDMHFVQGVDKDPIKLQFLKSIQHIAESCGTHVIAEGVETEAELRVVKDIGIACAQGYFIARPQVTPPLKCSEETQHILGCSSISVFPKMEFKFGIQTTAQKLLTFIDPAHPDTPNDQVFERFNNNPNLRIIPVVERDRPLGIINRYHFIDRFAKPFQRELLGKKSCKELIQGEPLLVELNMPIAELSHFLSESDSRHFADGFIITQEERYVGVASGQDLLRELTQMQLEAARYANPLTQLPGNVPINEHIDRLLAAKTPFVACYCDLDHFKPFNDNYSYRKGDEMIQLTGRVLSWACDPKRDFIGHIGRDDFILLMQSKDWRARCEQSLAAFEQAASLMFTEAHRAAGGYTSEGRDGSLKFHPLTSLSIGAVQVGVDQFNSHHEVSAAMSAAKKMAKKLSGNSLFVEQRVPVIHQPQNSEK